MVDKTTTTASEEFERWSTEIKRGVFSTVVLAELSKQSTYGYDLVRNLETESAFLNLEQSTVYPLLRRFELRGLLRSKWVIDDPTKPRKIYELTPAGTEALKMMMDAWKMLTQEISKILDEVTIA